MPTVHRIAGLRVVIYPSDHRPAHVHVVGSDEEAVFNLNCPDGPPDLRESFRISQAHWNRIARALDEVLVALCTEWERIHGDF